MRKLQSAIPLRRWLRGFQGWLRRLLGVPSQEEMQQLAIDLERKLNARVAVFSDIAESRIRAKSKELEKAEAEMQQLATDMTLAIYDAVEKIMAEIAEAKRLLGKEDNDIEKP